MRTPLGNVKWIWSPPFVQPTAEFDHAVPKHGEVVVHDVDLSHAVFAVQQLDLVQYQGNASAADARAGQTLARAVRTLKGAAPAGGDRRDRRRLQEDALRRELVLARIDHVPTGLAEAVQVFGEGRRIHTNNARPRARPNPESPPARSERPRRPQTAVGEKRQSLLAFALDRVVRIAQLFQRLAWRTGRMRPTDHGHDGTVDSLTAPRHCSTVWKS